MTLPAKKGQKKRHLRAYGSRLECGTRIKKPATGYNSLVSHILTVTTSECSLLNQGVKRERVIRDKDIYNDLWWW